MSRVSLYSVPMKHLCYLQCLSLLGSVINVCSERAVKSMRMFSLFRRHWTNVRLHSPKFTKRFKIWHFKHLIRNHTLFTFMFTSFFFTILMAHFLSGIKKKGKKSCSIVLLVVKNSTTLLVGCLVYTAKTAKKPTNSQKVLKTPEKVKVTTTNQQATVSLLYQGVQPTTTDE